MRRPFRILLIVTAAAGAIAWPLFYVWIMAMACTFGSPNATSCPIRMPWDLRGEDLDWLILRPGALMIALLLAIYLLRPRDQNSES